MIAIDRPKGFRVGLLHSVSVLPSFTGFLPSFAWFDRVLLGFHQVVGACRVFSWVTMHWIVPSFSGLSLVILNLDEFSWVLVGFTGFYWVLLGFIRFYWVLARFTGFYWALLGFY